MIKDDSSSLPYVKDNGDIDWDKVTAADFKSCGYIYERIESFSKKEDLIVYCGALLERAKSCGCIEIARELVECKKGIVMKKLSNANDKSPPFTVELLSDYLNKRGIIVRYNEVLHIVEVVGLDEKYNPEQVVEQLPAILHSDLKTEGTISSTSTVADYLSIIAGINTYNPVADLLEGVEWDGVDRIQVIFEIIHIDANDMLSMTLITKWLCQCLSLCIYNSTKKPFGAEGVLTLVGRQGIGKTTLCRKLGINNKLCRTGLVLDPHNKDDIIRATGCFIGELGELESTFRRDISALKGFLTDQKDSIRKPYDRSATEQLRRTSFIATCNSTDYLVDQTGNRRFFTIPCDHDFDLAKLASFDVIQLWAQVKKKVDTDGLNCFRLTKAEQRELEKRNRGHLRELRGQSEVQDILDKARSDPNTFEFVDMTVTEFKTYYSSLRPYTNVEIGKALSHLGIEPFQGRRRGSKSSERLRKLPRGKGRTYFRESDGEFL